MLDPAQFGRRRRVAGVMSGTSLDGIDVALATFEGSGPDVRVSAIRHFATPYSDAIREAVLRNSIGESSSVVELSQLNVRLAHLYAVAIKAALRSGGRESGADEASSIDLVGLHGQTVQHIPVAAACCGAPTRSTLQIGDASTLANLLGVPVVGDFRLADMALGGQGAPLVSYFDVVVLGHPTENRLALNLGGIANFTVLPAQSAASREYIAMDTGPANIVMDALANRFLGARYDDRGSAAARGVANEAVVYELLEDPYFLQPPPKTTGRELFGKDFVDRMIAALAARGTSVPENMLATAAELTARSVHLAFDRFVSHHGSSPHGIDRVIASGGGIRNDYLMRRLRELFAPVAVETTDDHGIPSEAKEALCFALLAHEYVNGVATSIPTATGATSATMLGKLCLPGRRV